MPAKKIRAPAAEVMRRIGTLVCAGLFVMLAGGCTPPGPRALLRGQRLLEQHRYGDAVEEFKLATSLMSTNAQAWNYLGLAYHYAGDVTNAALSYSQALKADRDLVEAHFNLGCLWLEHGGYDHAKSELATFALRRSDDIEGWLKLGSAQWHSRDLVQAEKSFREALRLKQDDPEALNGLGVVLAQRNRPRDAAQCFEAALKERPNYPPASLNLAVILQTHLNEPQRALQKYREYLALSPRAPDWDAVNSLATALDQQVNPQQPRPTPAPRIAEAAPSPPGSERSNNAPAHEHAPETKIVTSSVPVLANGGNRTVPAQSPVTHESASVPGQAVSADTNGSQSEPKRGFFRKLNPLNLFKHSQTQAQSEPLPNSSETAPADVSRRIPRYDYRVTSKPVAGDHATAESLFARAVRDHKAKHYPEALELYKQTVAADPAYFEAYYNMELAAMASGDLKDALMAGETALALRPDSLDARINFAQALGRAGYSFDAANELATVLRRDPDDARAHLALGNLYAQEFHQPDKAREHYEKVLDIDPRNAQAGAIREWLAAHPR